MARATWAAVSPRPVRAEEAEAARGLRAPLVQRADQAEPRPLEGGRRAEPQPDHHGKGEREREPRDVDADVVEPCDIAGDRRGQPAEHHDRRRHAENAAPRAQHHALRKELAHQPPPARAQSRADRERLPARDPAREQQARHVDAGDQKHEGGRDGQRQKRGPVSADHLSLQRDHLGVDLGQVGVGAATHCGRLGEQTAALQNGAHLGSRLLR